MYIANKLRPTLGIERGADRTLLLVLGLVAALMLGFLAVAIAIIWFHGGPPPL